MKSLKHTNKEQTTRGFTIIETLIALTLFSIAITGVITVAAKGSYNTNTAKNRLTATYLADEGIELMRGMRDTAVLQQGSPTAFTAGWLRFTSTASTDCTTASPCDVDGANLGAYYPFPQFSNFTKPCSTAYTGVAGSYCPLTYDPTTGFYNDQHLGDVTPFSRSIVVTWSPASPDEMQITSTVVWKEGQVMKSISQTESIFDWYPS